MRGRRAIRALRRLALPRGPGGVAIGLAALPLLVVVLWTPQPVDAA